MKKKKQPFPKMPRVEIYISGKELRRVEKQLKFLEGTDPGAKRSHLKAVRVRGMIGYHHIIPTLKAIVSYLERAKKYREETK